MFQITNEKGAIEINESALLGMVSQYIEAKNIENVKFIGFKKANHTVEGIKSFFAKKDSKEETVTTTDEKLVFNLEFHITALHPVHVKGVEIQDVVTECVENVLGLPADKVEVNVFFVKFKDKEELVVKK